MHADALFQLPGIAEALVRRGNFAIVERMFRKSMVHPGRISDEEIDRYRSALGRPGALEAALAYYRSAFRAALRDGFAAHEVLVRVPTQVIWGEQDSALGRELIEGLDRWVPDLRIDLIATASHWVQQDEPERVTELMLEFLGSPV